MTTYTRAKPEVHEMARGLIEAFHKDLKESGATIDILMAHAEVDAEGEQRERAVFSLRPVPPSLGGTMDLSHLNPEQHEAVTTTEGPLLVLAGAGSGKTRVIVHRIAHLAELGRATPDQILAVTFTRKAAAEMRVRLEDLIGPVARQVWMGTFHSICAKLLRPFAQMLGFTSSFTIYDDDQSRKVLKASLAAAFPGKEIPSVDAIAAELDRAKNRGVTPEVLYQLEPDRFAPFANWARGVHGVYQEALRRANAMDYGDLLVLTKRLLRDFPGVRTRVAGRFKYVLVDEFQDTNVVQAEILQSLTSHHHNLCVVGDDDQGIYRWRGAEPANILRFRTHYPDARVIKLERNYRSTSNILSAANAVIARNKHRHPKTLRTGAAAGAPVLVHYVSSSEEEAYLVADAIASHVAEGGRPDDCAVLYRINAQSREIELALRRAGLPYVLIGGQAFFERREVKDVLAYLRLVVNPSSEEDLARAIGVPPRGLGEKSLERIRAAGQRHDVAGARAFDLPDAELAAVGLRGRELTRIRELARLLGDLRELAARPAPAAEVARVLVERVGYFEFLRRDDITTAEDRIANVAELVSALAAVDAEGGEDDRTPLERALEAIALSSAADAGGEEGAVSLMTIHASKGLEFPVVFVVGLEEGTMPHGRALDGDAEDLEEERRLAYVAITRARERLHLVSARERRIYGHGEVRAPSRYLADLPPSVTEVRGRPPFSFSRELGGAA